MEVRDKLNTAEKYQSLIDMKRAFISEELKDLEELEQEKMAVLVKAQGLKDFLIDFLIRYKIPAWDLSMRDFADIRPYKRLRDVILLSKQDKGKAVNRLKTYSLSSVIAKTGKRLSSNITATRKAAE